jgi:hypothetical protein
VNKYKYIKKIKISYSKQAQSSLPIEKCVLSPKKECKDISTLVPSLQSVEKCMDIPKEVCSKVEQPRKVDLITKRMFCDGGKTKATPQKDYNQSK